MTEARKFTVAGKNDRRPFKPKPWSHQSELTAFKGQPVDLFLNSGVTVSGKLLEADQFTIKIFAEFVNDRQLGVNEQSEVIYFKSVLVGFRKA